MFLGLIQYVLACSVLCPYFFLAYWMTHDLVDLCFKLMWILWRKVCEWLEASNRWLILSLPNMCLMRWVGYTMMLSECLLLVLFLIMELTLDFADFLGTSNGSCWFHQKDFGGKDQEPWTWESSIWSSILHKSRGGSRRSSCKRTRSPNDVWPVFLIFFLQNKRKCSLDNLILQSMFSSLSLELPWIM